MVTAFDSRDDLLGASDPSDKFGFRVVFGKEAVDRGFEVDNGVRDASLGDDASTVWRGDAPHHVRDIEDDNARSLYGYGFLLLTPDMHIVGRSNVIPASVEELARTATGHQGIRPAAASSDLRLEQLL